MSKLTNKPNTCSEREGDTPERQKLERVEIYSEKRISEFFEDERAIGRILDKLEGA